MSQQPPQGPPEPPAPNQQWGPPQEDPNPHGGQPAPSPQVPAVLKVIPGAAWARALLIAAIFLGGSLVAAGITAAFGVGAVRMAADFSPDFQEFLPAGASWIVLTFQLLGMGFFSPLSLGFDIAEMGMSGAPGTIFMVPWLVPLGGIIAVMTTQRFVAGNLRVPTVGPRLLLAALAGLSFATVVTILSAAIRFRTYIDEFIVQGNMWAHAASFAGYLVAALLVGVVTYLLLLPRRGVTLQRALMAGTAVVEHLGVIGVVAAIAGCIAVLVQGGADLLLTVIFVLPNLALAAFSLVHFIPLVARSSEALMAEAGAETFTLFDTPVAAVIIGLVVMVITLGLVSLRWSLRTRFYAQAVWSWITLPIAYFVLGLLFTFANGLYLKMAMFGEAFTMSVSSAAWGFLLWPVLGAIIQVLAVYVMPKLAYAMPRGVLRAIGVGLQLPPSTAVTPQTGATPPPPPPVLPAPAVTPVAAEGAPAMEQTTVMPSVPHESIEATATAGASAQAVPPQADAWSEGPPAERRRMGRGAKVLLVSGLSVAVLAGLAWAAHGVLARTMFGPQHVAEAYLQAVVDGRAQDALAVMGPNVTDDLRVLAADEIYDAAVNRPDRFELGAVTRDGSTAFVEAVVHQAGKAYPVELMLTTSGTQAFVFADWVLEAGDVAGRAAYLSGPSTLTVNEVETEIRPSSLGEAFEPEYYDPATIAQIASESGQVLLPGTYLFSAPKGSTYLSHGEDLELTITPGEISETPIRFSQSYTPTLETDVIAAVRDRLESCLADRTIRVPDCEAASWEDRSWVAMRDMVRTWDREPVIEVVPVGFDFSYGDELDLTQYSGPVVARVTEGSILLSYQVRDSEDEDWMDHDWVYEPFEVEFYEPMEFPIILNGDEVIIDYSPLDQYNPDWLSAEFRD